MLSRAVRVAALAEGIRAESKEKELLVEEEQAFVFSALASMAAAVGCELSLWRTNAAGNPLSCSHPHHHQPQQPQAQQDTGPSTQPPSDAHSSDDSDSDSCLATARGMSVRVASSHGLALACDANPTATGPARRNQKGGEADLEGPQVTELAGVHRTLASVRAACLPAGSVVFAITSSQADEWWVACAKPTSATALLQLDGERQALQADVLQCWRAIQVSSSPSSPPASSSQFI